MALVRVARGAYHLKVSVEHIDRESCLWREPKLLSYPLGHATRPAVSMDSMASAYHRNGTAIRTQICTVRARRGF